MATNTVTSSTTEITNSTDETLLFQELASVSVTSGSIMNEYCNYGPLYRDAFILHISNFTSEKNGYYWIQISLNNTVSQPSEYAWFYAADNSSCIQQTHFNLAADPECAVFQSITYPSYHTSNIMSNITSSTTCFSNYPTPLATTLEVTTTTIKSHSNLSLSHLSIRLPTKMYSAVPLTKSSRSPLSAVKVNPTKTMSITRHFLPSTSFSISPTTTPKVPLTIKSSYLLYIIAGIFIFTVMSTVLILLVLYYCRSQRKGYKKNGKIFTKNNYH